MKPFLLLLLFPAILVAEEAPKPVSEIEYDDYDLETLKAGEWTLHETVWESPGEDGKVQRSGYRVRLACVKAEKDHVWIESSGWDLEADSAVSVDLCEVDRKTRRVLKAWISEKGGVAKTVDVRASEALKTPEAKPRGNGAGSDQVVEEKLKVGKRELKCNVLKKEEFHPDKNFKTITTKTNIWFSGEVPFRLRLTDAGVRKTFEIPETWSKSFKESQGLVKLDLAGGDANEKRTTTLVEFGTDAKATVKLK